MGQAAVDLPDPLNSSPPADSTASADDLLAQLAGDEIDRLLAESDDDASKPIASSGKPIADSDSSPDDVATATDDEQELGDVLQQLDGTADAAEAEASHLAAGAEAGNLAGKELDAKALDQSIADRVTPVVEKVRSQVTAQETEAAASQPAMDAQPAKKRQSQPAGQASIESEETSAAERSALDDSAEPAAMSSSQLLDYADDITLPLPLYLRPLEWLNAPLNAFPDSVRELVGKAAIITMFNAIAILAYVMLFRKG